MSGAKDKEKIIRYFEASGSGDMARRMLDLADQVVAGRPYRLTDFMTPAALTVAEAIKAEYPGILVKENGGYQGAERIRIAFVDADFKGTIDWGIKPLAVTWDPRFRLLTHRDVLGSLMGLGIDREHFGDIIVREGGATVLTDASVAEFVETQFTKIAMVSVSVAPMDLADIKPKEECVKEVRTTVASLRLDAVASSGFSMSRTKLVSLAKAGLVQINWQPAKGSAQEVKEGDIISLRGRGRMKIEAITGTSRKGRIGVYLKRFI